MHLLNVLVIQSKVINEFIYIDFCNIMSYTSEHVIEKSHKVYIELI